VRLGELAVSGDSRDELHALADAASLIRASNGTDWGHRAYTASNMSF
jgi:hypothetical protein